MVTCGKDCKRLCTGHCLISQQMLLSLKLKLPRISRYLLVSESWRSACRNAGNLSSTAVSWAWRVEVSDRQRKKRNKKHKHVNVTSAIPLCSVFYTCENSALSCKSENFGVETDDRNEGDLKGKARLQK